MWPGESELKWYHYGEPSIIDVTSYKDILKALENGRFKRIQKNTKDMKKNIKSRLKIINMSIFRHFLFKSIFRDSAAIE